MAYDKHHGQGGTFIGNKDGSRSPATPDKDGYVTIGDQKLHRPQTRPHEDGDAPRNAKGERVDRDAAQEAAAKPQPAMPEPAKTAPWMPPPAEDAAAKITDTKENKK